MASNTSACLHHPIHVHPILVRMVVHATVVLEASRVIVLQDTLAMSALMQILNQVSAFLNRRYDIGFDIRHRRWTVLFW